MKTKIKAFNIKGIRGIRENLSLNLNGSSTLIYGDNGSGKSSITDSIEFIYKNKIKHIKDEETGRTLKEAYRNHFLKNGDDALIELCYLNKALDCIKTLKGNLTEFVSNNSKEYEQYIRKSEAENIILRYSDLVEFIISPKKKRLDDLQKIIGFEEVGNLRDLLKKTAGRFKRTIVAENFNNKKGTQQSIIIQNFGSNAYNPSQFFKSANELIKPLSLNVDIKSFKDVALVLKQIESKDDMKVIEAMTFQTKIIESLTEFSGNIDKLISDYKLYFETYSELRKDENKFGKLRLLGLLNEGLNVLKNDVIKNDSCPLCLQEKNKIELINELNERIQELEELHEEKNKLQETNDNLKAFVNTNLTTIEVFVKDKKFKEKENEKTFDKLEDIKSTINRISSELNKDLLAKESILDWNSIIFNKDEIQTIIESAKKILKQLSISQEHNAKLIIHSKLLLSQQAFKEYLKIEKRQQILTRQQDTFESLFADFIKRQEEALSVFLKTFSSVVNDYYTTMNPNEKVEGIKLVSLKDKNDDLAGVTIEYVFFEETKTQPRAYLSESHINCLGLSFFLASVKAFNKENNFFLLDDVISSFDRGHRARFAKLLIDKFNDYQIILLTHEKDFFELISSEVKRKGWNIYQITWTPEKGTDVEKGTSDSKERIKKKFEERDTDGLGNDIRIYTEKVLKEIAANIEANVIFKYNDSNEKRMASELLDSIQNKISSKSTELKAIVDIPRIKGMPMFIGNTASHDNDFQTSIEDLEVMWEDIGKLIKLFYCKDCNKFISTKYLDTVRNRIRCGCQDEKLNYDWKK
jgi:recombinational DNA repair ATPase RecF